jgi:hypothetical protein
VVVTTAALAAIENLETGSVTIFRKNNRLALGPLGRFIG